MSESENQAANWTMGLVGSILLHVAVVGLFVMLGRPSAPTETTEEPPAPVPVVDAPTEADPPARTEPTRTEPARPTPVRPRVEPVTPPSVRPADNGPKHYVVQKGDNASKIAKKHDLTLQELAKLNGMTLQQLGGLAIGQKLKVAE